MNFERQQSNGSIKDNANKSWIILSLINCACSFSHVVCLWMLYHRHTQFKTKIPLKKWTSCTSKQVSFRSTANSHMLLHIFPLHLVIKWNVLQKMQEVLISVTQVILHQRRALTTVFLLCVMKLLADCLQTLSSDTLHRRLACGLLPPNHYLNISAIVLCSGQEVQKLCRKRQNYAVNHDIRPTK